MRKIEFVFAALLLVGCSKPDEEQAPQSGHVKTYDDISSSAPINAPPQDAKQAPRRQPKSEMMDYMRAHTKKPGGSPKEGEFKAVEGAFK